MQLLHLWPSALYLVHRKAAEYMHLLTNFAAEYSYYNLDGNAAGETRDMSLMLLLPALVAGIVVGLICLASLWRIYEKAGYAGWKAIVPIYNVVILLRIVDRPAWWLALYLVGLIPLVGWAVALAVSIIVDNDLSKSFGKDTGFSVLMIFLPFVALPMLAFGDATFRGAAPEPQDDTIQQ